MDSIDFLPERIRSRRARRRRLIRQAYLLAACVAVLALVGFLRQGRIASARADLSGLQDRQISMETKTALRNALEQQLADLMVKKRIDDGLGSRVDPLDILAELGRLLPDSMALASLNLEAVEFKVPVEPVAGNESSRAALSVAAPTAKAKEQTVKRVRLVITGLAPTDVDVANFIGQVSASPLFEDVNMGYTKTVSFRGRAAREFQTSCYVAR